MNWIHALSLSTRWSVWRPRPARTLAMLLAAAAMVAMAATVGGCGGGVGTGGTGSFASAFASGPITGFGSIIVNDVRFDDSSARVEDVDGGPRSRDELQLGMTVEVESSPIVASGSGPAATATRVRITSELLGPVAGVDAAAGLLRLLGQTVAVDANTVFDESLPAGLSSLAAGRLVEVYALFDAASGRYRATRIEPRASASAYQLRGVPSALDAAARTMVVGGATFAYGGVAALPADLAPGQFVRMRLQPADAASARWTVSGFGSATTRPPEQAGAKVKGLITAFTSVATFNVNGQPVNTAGASFPGGMAFAPGVRVEVEGTMVGGILQATRVTIESEQSVSERGFDLRGPIGAVNVAARTFVLRGQSVSWARPDLRLDNGTLADIAPGRQVEVRAMLAAGGTRLEATRIKFE